ncbi:MAG: hypothetical protein LBI28_01580 [Treponema sp.]|nr:hypothetical protein [Treponema sp.]
MKKLFVIISISLMLISLLLVISCDLFNFSEAQGNFWAVNTRNNIPYKVSADLIYEGIHCYVWVEKGSGGTYEQAKKLADAFDADIYQKMKDAFGVDIDYERIKNLFIDSFNPGKNTLNTMELTDLLGDDDGKLCILMLDIKDNYKKDVNDSYVAGYFSPNDFLNVPYSNKRDMIYIDTNPGMKDFDEDFDSIKKTLAHEMQHMMNFISTIAIRWDRESSNIAPFLMDTWIDEGLSSAAEYIIDEKHLKGRVDYYTNGNYGLIGKGNNFFVWGNREKEDQYAILDDYATVYLFFQWLRLQSDKDKGVYGDIIVSEYSDYKAVFNTMKDDSFYLHWEYLLGTWLAANYINNTSGPYGYMNDEILSSIKVPAPSSLGTSVLLFPGEGVYSTTTSAPSISGQGTNIRNLYLLYEVQNNYFQDSILLTFNANINKEGATETGVTTGTPAGAPPKSSMSTDISSGSRSVQSSILSGPYRIDARDMLRRNGHEFSVFDFSGSLRGARIVE